MFARRGSRRAKAFDLNSIGLPVSTPAADDRSPRT
jgi:hypothetical protein